MKIYNKILTGLLIPALGLTVMSCSDKNENEDYKPAEMTGNYVYFPSNVSTTFEVDEDASYLEIPVCRISDSGTFTVTIEVDPLDTYPTPLFTIDPEVTFQDGEKTAYIKAYYDIAGLEYEDMEQYALYIPEEYVSPYALGEETVSLYYPAPWRELGFATFIDEMFGSETEPYEVEVMCYQSELYPEQFRLFNPYYPINEEETYFYFQLLEPGMTVFGVPITLPNLVYFDYYPITYIDSFEGVVYIVWPGSLGSQFASEDKWKYNYVNGYQTNGLPGEITLSPLYYALDSGFWAGDTSADQTVHIIFPGYDPKDISAEVSYEGMLLNDGELSVLLDVTLGADVTSAKAGVAMSRDPEAVADAIKAGTIETVDVTGSGSVKIPFSLDNESGSYTAVVVTYNDEMTSYGSATFGYISIGSGSGEEQDPDWTSLGYAEYTDVFVSTFFTTNYPTYEVEVQEYNALPGLFRLVNPYGAAFPYNDIEDYDPYTNSYLVIDASNPTRVYIDYSPTTMNWGYGDFRMWSLAAYYLVNGYTEEEIDEMDYFGTYADGKISFPGASLLVSMANYGNGGFYVGNCIYTEDEDEPFELNPDGSIKTPVPYILDLGTLKSTASYSTRNSKANVAIEPAQTKTLKTNAVKMDNKKVRKSRNLMNVRPSKSNFFELKKM